MFRPLQVNQKERVMLLVKEIEVNFYLGLMMVQELMPQSLLALGHSLLLAYMDSDGSNVEGGTASCSSTWWV